MPRGAKIDRTATKEAKFLDPRSFISKNGDYYLRGTDMELRRMEVFTRSKGLCECGCGKHIWWETFHLHHLTHRGHGGSENLDNLAAWTPACHLRHHGQLR